MRKKPEKKKLPLTKWHEGWLWRWERVKTYKTSKNIKYIALKFRYVFS